MLLLLHSLKTNMWCTLQNSLESTPRLLITFTLHTGLYFTTPSTTVGYSESNGDVVRWLQKLGQGTQQFSYWEVPLCEGTQEHHETLIRKFSHKLNIWTGNVPHAKPQRILRKPAGLTRYYCDKILEQMACRHETGHQTIHTLSAHSHSLSKVQCHLIIHLPIFY